MMAQTREFPAMFITTSTKSIVVMAALAGSDMFEDRHCQLRDLYENNVKFREALIRLIITIRGEKIMVHWKCAVM